MNTRTLEEANSRKSCRTISSYTKIKYLLILFAGSLILNIMLSSCDDGYSLNDLYGDYGVVHKATDDYTIILDDGSVLYPSVSNVSLSNLKDSARVIVYYTILGDADSAQSIDYYVKVEEIYNVLTKNILEYKHEISDSLGYDPVTFNNIWIRNGFINFDLFFGGGQAGVKHMLNLARHPEKTTDGRILLEFRHNAFDDLYNYRYRGLVAFPTKGITDDLGQDSILLRVTYHDFDKESSLDITWYPKEDKVVGKTLPVSKEVITNQNSLN